MGIYIYACLASTSAQPPFWWSVQSALKKRLVQRIDGRNDEIAARGAVLLRILKPFNKSVFFLFFFLTSIVNASTSRGFSEYTESRTGRKLPTFHSRVCFGGRPNKQAVIVCKTILFTEPIVSYMIFAGSSS